MKFVDDNTDPHVFYRKVSEDGRLEVAVAPVMYGFRIRSGNAGKGFYELDYCAGNNLAGIETIYSIVLTALSNGIDFNKFPVQNTKPMHNDPECFVKLFQLVEGMDLIKVKTPDVHAMKSEYLTKLWKVTE